MQKKKNACHIFTLRSSILALRLAHLFCSMLKFCWVWVVPGPDSSPPRASSIDSPWSSRRWYWSALWASWAWSSCRKNEKQCFGSESLYKNNWYYVKSYYVSCICFTNYMAQRYIASYNGLFPPQGIKMRLCCIMTVVKPFKKKQNLYQLATKGSLFQKRFQFSKLCYSRKFH